MNEASWISNYNLPLTRKVSEHSACSEMADIEDQVEVSHPPSAGCIQLSPRSIFSVTHARGRDVLCTNRMALIGPRAGSCGPNVVPMASGDIIHDTHSQVRSPASRQFTLPSALQYQVPTRSFLTLGWTLRKVKKASGGSDLKANGTRYWFFPTNIY